MSPVPFDRRLVTSPFGPLTLTARNGALVALDWGALSGQPGRKADPGTSHSPLLDTAAAQLAAYFAGALTRFDLPLAPAGTAFQHRVWDRLTTIPYGATASYGAIARNVESAPRAIGGACGKNPLPILIPCHRVVGAGGALGGYTGAGGAATKRALLQLEQPA